VDEQVFEVWDFDYPLLALEGLVVNKESNQILNLVFQNALFKRHPSATSWTPKFKNCEIIYFRRLYPSCGRSASPLNKS
jgi:hypothetical protein